MKILFKILLFVSGMLMHPFLIFSQHVIKGQVIDSAGRKPLAFVNILFNDNENTGITTDIDGRFYYQQKDKIMSMSLSYVGYKSIHIGVDSIDATRDLILAMSASNLELAEVIILPDDNPAIRIIQQVIANKKNNDPENLPSFTYTFYNKLIYDFVIPDSLSPDTTELKTSFLEDSYLGIMESVTEGKFKGPARYQETITGVKVSGFKHPSFAPLATEMQPFTFYNNIIRLLDIYYLNPIADGATGKYQYILEDTIFSADDTIFVISFKPLQRKNFQALQGLLYVNTNKYALQNVIAEPNEKGLVNLKIQQQYMLLNNQHWFPVQLNYELRYLSTADDNGIFINGKSYLQNANLDTILRSKDFSVDAVKMSPEANDRDAVFWKENRPDSLNAIEKNTYLKIDSLGEKYDFDVKLKLLESIYKGKIRAGLIDIDLNKIISFNNYEGIRIGLGLSTNDRISEHAILGGFAGYGIKDHSWKYGGSIRVTPGSYDEFFLEAGYEHTLKEAGVAEYIPGQSAIYSYRGIIGYKMDNIDKKYAELNFRAFKYGIFNISLNNTDVRPAYTYILSPAADSFLVDYTTTDITIRLRYAFHEKLLSSYGNRTSLGTNYPLLYLNYTTGINGLFGSTLKYNKAEVSVEQSFFSRNAGTSRYKINAGITDGPLPYGLLFTGQGSYDKNFSFVFSNYFQTATPYEFLSDRYVNVFLSHNFGDLLLQINNFKPEFMLLQNIGFGSLMHPGYHILTDFKTMEKGLYESGIQVNNLLKFKYSNLAYFGLGAAVFYRYGPYSYATLTDNFAFKLCVSFSTK